MRRNDRVIISKTGDSSYGLVGTIISLSGMEVEVAISGQSGTRRFRQTDVSGIPLNVAEREPSIIWYVEVDFLDESDSITLTFERQPGVTWGNGMVKVEGSDDIHLFLATTIRHIRVHC